LFSLVITTTIGAWPAGESEDKKQDEKLKQVQRKKRNGKKCMTWELDRNSSEGSGSIGERRSYLDQAGV